MVVHASLLFIYSFFLDIPQFVCSLIELRCLFDLHHMALPFKDSFSKDQNGSDNCVVSCRHGELNMGLKTERITQVNMDTINHVGMDHDFKVQELQSFIKHDIWSLEKKSRNICVGLKQKESCKLTRTQSTSVGMGHDFKIQELQPFIRRDVWFSEKSSTT